MAKIAVDSMGGDNAPDAVLEGVALSLQTDQSFEKLILVGKPDVIRDGLEKLGIAGNPRLEIVEATQIVEMHESPAKALRTKKQSSIAVCSDLVKQGEANAIFSAGHTGAAVASTVLKWRTLPGIERPGIATAMPTPTGPFVLLDAGANPDAKPRHLVQYAIMGEAYADYILGINKPRVGILSVGGEEGKGNELSKTTFEILSKVKNINFIGNVEGHDLYEHGVDVVVCDGFVGNVVLKASESLAKAIFHILKDKLQQNWVRRLGAGLAYSAFREVKRISDCDEYGGAPLLGVNGVCIIGHGSSSPKSIQNAIRVAGEFIAHQVNDQIVERVKLLDSETE